MKTHSLCGLVIVVVTALLGAYPSHADPQPPRNGRLSDARIAEAQSTYDAWDSPEQPIGPNHRTTLRTTPSGPHRIVEVATGMNFWDGHQWSVSIPSFAPAAGGLVAGQIQHQVFLASDLNTKGAVSVRTPEGIQLSSTPVGIALYDAANGHFSVIAAITNSTAVLVNSNTVVYEDAFSGGVCANVLFSISAGTFNQDVVLTGQLDPATYGFPRETTRIQILTEFYDPPVPERVRRPLHLEADSKARARMVTPDLIDEQLGFGRFVLTLGKAYVAPSQANTNGLAAWVAKEFTTTAEGRTLLVESIPYAAIADELKNLPACHPLTSSLDIPRNKGYAGIPRPGKKSSAARVIQQARGARSASMRGVVIDYVANVGSSSGGTTVFKSDTTYLISSAVSINNAAVIEGGAVFKYASGASLSLNGPVTCKTGMYRPAILTSVDDDSVGSTMNGVANSGYTGIINPNGYANPALAAPNNAMAFSGLRIRYAVEGIQVLGNGLSWSVSHSQFVDCLAGVVLQGCAGGTVSSEPSSFNLENCLFSRVSTPVQGAVASGAGLTQTVSFFNSTVDSASMLSSAASGITLNVQAVNSIFANVTNASGGAVTLSGNNNALFNHVGTGTSAFGGGSSNVTVSPFQSVGAGGYYLAPDSGLQGTGTPMGLPAGLATDLAKRTVYPPAVVGSLTGSPTLSPYAPRDTMASSPGYHYDPIDYAMSQILLTNATLTVGASTVIAGYGTSGSSPNYGLAIGQGASLQCQGTPNNPNWIVAYNTVQEQEIIGGWMPPVGGLLLSEFQGLTPGSTINCRFTDWSVPALDEPAFSAPANSGPLNFRDCEFHGGQLLSAYPSLTLTNCLLERVYADIEPRDGQVSWLRNNLFYGGQFTLVAATSSGVRLYDNLLDQTAIHNSDGYTGGHNAFVTGCSRLQPTQANDIILSSEPTYQTGPFGSYYIPPDSVLINAGSAPASEVGLSQYTVSTNLVGGVEVKEGATIVDVSYHYVATDTSGKPLNALGDGTPDYLRNPGGSSAPSLGAQLAGGLGATNVLSSGLGTSTLATATSVGTVASGNGGVVADTSPPCVPASSSLVSWWRAEGNYLDANGINNGVLEFGSGFGAGEVGQAFSFNGSDSVMVSNSPSLQFSADFTIECWINASSTTGDQSLVSKVGISSGVNNGYQLVLSTTAGTTSLIGQFNNPGQNWPGNRVQAALSIVTGAWYHVAWTYDQTAMRLYTNGTLAATANASGSVATSTDNFHLSGDDNNHVYFNGLIDEASVYNAALSAGQIAAIYEAGSGGKCPPTPTCAPVPQGLVSWWRAEGYSVDSEGANNGTAQGVTTYAAGEVGDAFSFGTSGSVMVADSPSLRFSTSFTIECWINGLSTTGDQSLVAKVGGSGGNNGYQLVLSGTTLIGQFNSLGQPWPQYAVQATVPITMGAWAHVAWTYDYTNMVLYWNGQVLTTHQIGNCLIAQTNSNFHISGDDNYHVYFDGLIDEVSVYDVALTASQIASIYNAGSLGKCITNGAGSSPSITAQPQSQTVCSGSGATFIVGAKGTAPLSYQWTLNQTNIPGATSSSYSVTNTQSEGPFAVIVTNSLGSATSSSASLTVNALPTLTTAPQSTTVYQGGNATFTVVAGGASPFTYLWIRNGSALTGASGSSYTIYDAQPSDATSYAVQVWDINGCTITSPAVNLTVIQTAFSVLLNLDFGGAASSPKSGPAAVGETATDFWNYLGPQAPGPTYNLLNANQSVSPVSVTASGLTSAGTNGSSDAMYNGFIYAPQPNSSGTLTLNNLPTGAYDVYAYSYDGNFSLSTSGTGGAGYGSAATGYNNPPLNPPPWVEFLHYASWQAVPVTSGQGLVLTVAPGAHDGYAVICGLQVAMLDPNYDGVEECWEMATFGATGVNPSADPNGDGLSNWQNYLWGTSPTQPNGFSVWIGSPTGWSGVP